MRGRIDGRGEKGHAQKIKKSYFVEMLKFLKYLAIFIASLVVFYLLGPKKPIPKLDASPTPLSISIDEVADYVQQQEAAIPNIKPDNASQLVWYADSLQQQTPYSVVYLHGYSASPEEGAPIHLEIAKRYGANFYAPRLFGHGLQSENPMLDVTPEKLLASAKEAIAIGKIIGKKVILVTCSTGSTLGLFAAQNDADIAGHILYSPNIDVYDSRSELLIKPWGLQIARQVFGGNFREFEANEEVRKYWVHRYRLEGVIALKLLVKATMKEETFKNITQPLFVGYYYKNEEEQDKAISVARILEMYEQLGTPANQKEKMAFSTVGAHVLASKYWSKDLDTVRNTTFRFIEEKMGIRPIN